MSSDLRAHWLAQGVDAEDLETLESLAPLDQWAIRWETYRSKEDQWRHPPEESGPGKEPGTFLTRVKCPKCGCEGTYHLDAVTDFHCEDDQDCGYDYLEDDEGLKPLPGNW